ncbi:hypothetical protein WUBG_00507 [Wuchereria bancrofti]|uniref:Uncharacterized protein n=1 Tax=Wuchereria bancrofti TaxID=6293 RepID=J9F271_WUCBA|nr:hypothetical protein WUBG_00507 [Wuchereria bancrofti]
MVNTHTHIHIYTHTYTHTTHIHTYIHTHTYTHRQAEDFRGGVEGLLTPRWCDGDDWEPSVGHCRNLLRDSVASRTRSLQFMSILVDLSELFLNNSTVDY